MRSANGSTKTLALDVLTEVPDWIGSMKANDLLQTIPKVGRVKAGRMMNVAQCGHSKTVAGLTERQRGALRDEINKLNTG